MIIKLTAILLGTMTIAGVAIVIWALCMIVVSIHDISPVIHDPRNLFTDRSFEFLRKNYEKEKPAPTSQQ